MTGATSITASLRLWHRYLEPNRLRHRGSTIKQVLRTITYDNAAQDPDTTDRIVTFIANDGTDDSIVATTTVTITAVNDPAVMDLDADDSSGSTGADFDTAFTEDGGAVAIADVDASLIDVDNVNLISLTVTITNQLDGTAETLAADVTGATSIGTASYDSGTGVLSSDRIADTVAHYQAGPAHDHLR